MRKLPPLLITIVTLLTSCSFTQIVQIDGLSVEIPSNFKHEQSYMPNNNLEYIFAASEESVIFIMGINESINIGVAKDLFLKMAKHMQNEIIANMTARKFEAVKFGDYDAECASLTSVINGREARGRIKIVNNKESSYLIIGLCSDFGNDIINTIMNTIVISESTKPKEPVNIRIKQYVASMNKMMPQRIDDATTYLSVECSDNCFIQSYIVDTYIDQYTPRELHSICKNQKESILNEIYIKPNSLLDEWIASGGTVKYVYYCADHQPFFSFTIDDKAVEQAKLNTLSVN